MNINLLPVVPVHKRYPLGYYAITIVLPIILVVLSGLVCFLEYRTSISVANSLAISTNNINALQSELLSIERNRQGDKSQIEANAVNGIEFSAFVENVDKLAIQNKVIVTELDWAGKNIKISGTVKSLSDLASFENDLSSIQNMNGISIPTVNQVGNGMEFTLNATWSGR